MPLTPSVVDTLHTSSSISEICVLTPSAPSSYYYYCRQRAKPLWSRDNKSEILGHLSECKGRRNLADVKQPQAVLPTKNLILTLLPVSLRPIFRPFCSDAIGVLWRHGTGEEVDSNGVLQS